MPKPPRPVWAQSMSPSSKDGAIYRALFKEGPWFVYVRLGEVAGRIECVHLEVRLDPEGRPAPITAEGLRALAPGRFIEAARRGLKQHVRVTHRSPSKRSSDWSDRTSAALGRPVFWDQERLEELAQVYLEAWRVGLPPTDAVAKHFGISQSAAAKAVARARHDQGLLDETMQGKAGGPPRRKQRRKT